MSQYPQYHVGLQYHSTFLSNYWTYIHILNSEQLYKACLPKKIQAATVVYDGTIVFGNSRKIVQHNEAPEDVATVIYDSKHAGQSNVFGPILDDRLKEKILKPRKGAHSSHYVCLSVRGLKVTSFGIGT